MSAGKFLIGWLSKEMPLMSMNHCTAREGWLRGDHQRASDIEGVLESAAAGGAAGEMQRQALRL